MKQFFLLFVVLLMVCSCSDEILNEDNHQAILGASNVTFSFDSITSNGNWKLCSFKQKFDACQIPDSLLSELTTKELVELCASHPLNPICYAYNNPMDGAQYIMKNFNGFKELQKREDAAERLLDFYEGIDFINVTNSPYPISLKGDNNKVYSGSNIQFIELILASGELPSLYNKTNMERLDRVSYNKFEQKLVRNDTYGVISLSNSLIIQSQVALKSNKLTENDRGIIRNFYNSCGGSSDISTISKILYK